MNRSIALICITSIIYSNVAFAQAEQDEQTISYLDDWVTTPRPNNFRDKLCGGYFLEKEYPDTNEHDSAVNINADSVEHYSEAGSIFKGNVELKQGQKTLTTDELHLEYEQHTEKLTQAYAAGNVTITEPNIRIDGTSAMVDYREDVKKINDPVYRIYNRHGFGKANSLAQEGSFLIRFKQADYTTCAPNMNTWRIKAKKLKLDRENGRGHAWHSLLYVKDVPVMYWPYVNFPIDKRRQSGFLTPSFTLTSRNGTSIGVPYYFNLAPNHDATITPKYMSKRGFKLDNEFRYLAPSFAGELAIFYLPHDRGYRAFRSSELTTSSIPRTDPRYRGLRDFHKRYGVNFKHAGILHDPLDIDINYTKVGDDNFIYDFPENFTNQINSNQLLQRGTINLREELGTASFTMQQHQTLYPLDGAVTAEAYRLLPSIHLHSKTFESDNAYSFDVYGSYSHFKTRTIPFLAGKTTGERFHLRPSITKDFGSPAWFVKPKFQMDFLSYNELNLSPQDRNLGKTRNPYRSIPIYSIDSGLFLTRDTTIFRKPYQNTLEPRLFYLNVPKRDQNKLPVFDSGETTFSYAQIFNDNRYHGLDRLSNANQLGMGISSYLLDDISGVEKAHISIGRVKYFSKPEAMLGENIKRSAWSPYVMEASYYLGGSWSLNGSTVRQPIGVTQIASINANYQNNNNVFNVGYQFNRNDSFNHALQRKLHTDQLLLSTAWHITSTDRFLGKVNYDLNLNRLRNTLIGWEREGCCTIIRFLWGRTLLPSEDLTQIKRDNKFYLQFVLKGFTDSIGNADRKFIQGNIPGYVDYADKF